MSGLRNRVRFFINHNDGLGGRAGRRLLVLTRPLRGRTNPGPDADPRSELIELLPTTSAGAEIGVHRGDFSRVLLDRLEPKRLHLVDPWRYFPSSEYEDSWYGGKAGGGERNMDRRFHGVERRFRKEIAAGVVVMHRDLSWDAAEQIEDGSLDWAYIDGDHSYDAVKRDLAAYLPKITDGGLLTGDDYFQGGWWGDGVKRAVDELIAQGSVEPVMLDQASRQWAVRVPTTRAGEGSG